MVARKILKVAAAVAVGLAPLALVAEELPVFSHKYHIEEEGLGCGHCHRVDTEKGPPDVNKESCLDCHDEAPDYKFPQKAGEMQVQFPHPLHVWSAECVSCHKPTADDSHEAGAPFLTQKQCVSCHKDNGVEVRDNDCKKCHGADRRREKPSDHKFAWIRKHGKESRWRVFDKHGQDCTECHENDTCTTCHRNTRPRSHTALWRLRTHGKAASWDRDACKTCHETGTCVRCHRDTAPVNHNGAWEINHGFVARNQMDSTCAVCHSKAECIACHTGRLR